MPQGLQLFNASGQMILDLTSDTFNILGSFDTTTANGSFTVPETITSPDILDVFTVGLNGFLANPNISISGNVISWSFDNISYIPTASRSLNRVYYGVR